MEFYFYMFKFSTAEARPNAKWLRRCRWYGIKDDGSQRFKNVMSYLEAVSCPFFIMEVKGNRYVVVVKAGGLREKFAVMCPDLVYDVVISPDRLESLEGDKWIGGKYKVKVQDYAIYLLGLETNPETKMAEVKEKFKQLYERAKNEIK
jgi:hypothetical protein